MLVCVVLLVGSNEESVWLGVKYFPTKVVFLFFFVWFVKGRKYIF